MKKLIMIGICMILVTMFLGCAGFGGGSTNETKLSNQQGLGIVGTLKIDEMNPGLDGYISLTVRNNLGGESASNVQVSLDNVEPFKIFECGEVHDVSSETRTCAGSFSLDKDLPWRVHGEDRMFPGEELEFFWRLKAPDKDEISNIALRHPIYFDLEFDYKTTFVQNIIFMSQQEVLRRRQLGEAFDVEGEANSGAGELKVTGATKQPVIYFFKDPSNRNSIESDFSFPIQYSVKNDGEGIPISDVVVLIEIPRGKLGGGQDIEPDMTSMEEYGWQVWNTEWDGRIHATADSAGRDAIIKGKEICDTTGGVDDWRCLCFKGNEDYGLCDVWIDDTYDNDFEEYFGEAITDGRLLVKIVKRTDFIDQFSIYLPLKLVGEDKDSGMTALKSLQVPIQIYGFKIYNMYRYFTEGESDIVVFPIRI